MKKAFFIIVTTILVIACTLNKEEMETQTNVYFRYDSVDVRDPYEDRIANRVNDTTVLGDTSDRVNPYQPWAIRFSILAERTEKVPLQAEAAWGFFNQAYAAKMPVDPEYYFPLHSMERLTVTSLKAYDDAHPAGSEISEYFRFTDQITGKHNSIRLDSFPAFLMDSTVEDRYSNDYYSRLEFFLDTLYPTKDSIQQFAFEIRYNDGVTLYDTTRYITISVADTL